MVRKPKVGTLKSLYGKEKGTFEVEEEPIRRGSIGRPNWWFNGSLFVPRTMQERRLSTLQYQTLTRHEMILSKRASRIRCYISLLSEWFPIPLLDEVGKVLLVETDLRQTESELFAHFLGVLELGLRQRHSTIRWSVLQEINRVSGHFTTKKDIYKWFYYTRHRRKEQSGDTLRLVQHLTIEALSQESLPPERKRQACLHIIQAVKTLRRKGFVCKDPEVASWALKRIILEEKGPQTDIPRELRATTTRMSFRIRQIILKENV